MFTVNGQHVYSDQGAYTIHVTLHHEAAPDATVADVAQIAGATTSGGPGIEATGKTFTGYERSTLAGVTVATFTDGDGSLPTADFSASIDWGDSATSAGSVTLSGGTYRRQTGIACATLH